MTTGTSDYALLSKDSYQSHQVDDRVTVGGHTYRVLASTSDAATGYQGTAYQRTDTGEVIIAHRGTEQIGRDGVLTDGGMVLAGVNVQTADAMAFTKQAMEEAKRTEARFGHPIDITVTGHSLGGTLAEITAFEYGLHGETFNAYGAVDLMQGIPEGGSQVIDHVCATDMVSAGSRHFGKVVAYATAADIQRLEHAGYRDDNNLLTPRDPFAAFDLAAHGIDNFVPDSKRLGESIISPENAARYHEHQAMIDRYRNDVFDLRTGASLQWEVPLVAGQTVEQGVHATERAVVRVTHAAGEALTQGTHMVEREAHHLAQETAHGARAIQHGVEHVARTVTNTISHTYDAAHTEVVHDAQAAGHAVQRGVHATKHSLSQGTQSAEHAVEAAAHRASQALGAVGGRFESKAPPASPLSVPASASAVAPPATPISLDQSTHPDHVLFRQALAGVHQVDVRMGRTPDQYSDNLAGALTVAAKTQCMGRIDEVAIHEDGTRAFAAQNHGVYRTFAEVPTDSAVATPLAQSSAAALAVPAPTPTKNPYAEPQEQSLQPTHHAAPGLH